MFKTLFISTAFSSSNFLIRVPEIITIPYTLETENIKESSSIESSGYYVLFNSIIRFVLDIIIVSYYSIRHYIV